MNIYEVYENDGIILQFVFPKKHHNADTSLSKNRRADWRRDLCQELFPNRGIVVRVSAVITQAINERTQSLLTLSLLTMFSTLQKFKQKKTNAIYINNSIRCLDRMY